jgi:hypothetical protein
VFTSATGVISTTLTQYTDALARSAAGAGLASGNATNTGITFTNNTGASRIDAVVSLAGFSVNALSDVDTATTAPTNGQALVWESASSLWKPGTISGGGGGGSLPDVLNATFVSNIYTPAEPSAGTLEVTYLLSPTANSTVNLTNIVPSAGNKGMKLNFKKLTSFYVLITPSTGVAIDGLTSGTDMIQQYSALTLQSTGSAWIIL